MRRGRSPLDRPLRRLVTLLRCRLIRSRHASLLLIAPRLLLARLLLTLLRLLLFLLRLPQGLLHLPLIVRLPLILLVPPLIFLALASLLSLHKP